MLIGHQRIWDFLTKSAGQRKLAHAYLFIGPSQVGKMTLALEFAKWLLCEKNDVRPVACGECKSCLDIIKNQHPDVFVLAAKQIEKKEVVKSAEIGIDEIRALQHQLILRPYSAFYKIAIIEEASGLSDEAANAFLKTLEEPSSRSLIILISSFWQALLPTIVSRCQTIKFLSVPEIEMIAGLKRLAKKETDLKKALKLAAGQPGRAIKLLSEPGILDAQEETIASFEKLLRSDLASRFAAVAELSRNTIATQETLSWWLLWLRDRILEINGRTDLTVSSFGAKNAIRNFSQDNLVSACREIQKTQAILGNSSFNARLALEVLMTKI